MKYKIKNKKEQKMNKVDKIKNYEILVETLEKKDRELSNKKIELYIEYEKNNDKEIMSRIKEIETQSDKINLLINNIKGRIRKFFPIDVLYKMYFYCGEKNEHILKIGEMFNEIFEFFKENTNLSEEEIINKINEGVDEIHIVDKFEDNPGASACYNSIFKSLEICAYEISSKRSMYLLRHEFTHLLGIAGNRNKEFSGYQISNKEENTLPIIKKIKNPITKFMSKVFHKKILPQEQNRQFNEACVDLFATRDCKKVVLNMEEYGMDFSVYSNEMLYDSSYQFNTCLVRQMLIAKQMKEDELFKGLFDNKASKKVIKKFGKKTFKKISSGMEEIRKIWKN